MNIHKTTHFSTFAIKMLIIFGLLISGHSSSANAASVTNNSITPLLSILTNDSVDAPVVISSFPFQLTEDVSSATVSNGIDQYQDPISSCNNSAGVGQGYRTVWYMFKPTQPGILSLNTTGSYYDTIISVWHFSEASKVFYWPEFACNDNSGGVSTSSLELDILPYFINNYDFFLIEVVSKSSLSSGTLVFNADFKQTNDDYLGPIGINSLPYQHSQNVGYASETSTDPQLSCAGNSAGYKTVWYTIAPTTSEDITIDTAGSDYDTILALWEFKGFEEVTFTPKLEQIDCSDVQNFGLLSVNTGKIQTTLMAGSVYYIEVASKNSGGGDLVLNVDLAQKNDPFSNAFTVDPLPYQDTQNVVYASGSDFDPQLTCAGNITGYKTIWYTFTPTESTDFTINTSGSDYDTVLAVWTGSREALTNVACSDGASYGMFWVDVAKLQLTLEADTTYFIEVASKDSSGGDLVLNIDVSPKNDPFRNAYSIGSLPYTDDQNVDYASLSYFDPPLPCAANSIGYKTVWYTFTPDVSADITIDTVGSDYDTVVSVWTGTQEALTNVACNDNVSSGLLIISTGKLQLTLMAGTTYYIEIASKTSLGGDLVLKMDLSPKNDPFQSAYTIGSLPYTDKQNVDYASGSYFDPPLSCAANSKGYKTVWYTFTPTESEIITIDTVGSNYDTVVALWTGTRESLTSVACNDGSSSGLFFINTGKIQKTMQAGTTYFIEVASKTSIGGDLILKVYRDTTPPSTSIALADGQSDPAYRSPINFTITFSEAIDPTTFDGTDITITQTGTDTFNSVINEVSPNDGTTFNVAIRGMSGGNRITANMKADKVMDIAGNGNTASGSVSVDFILDSPADFVFTINTGDTSSFTIPTIGSGYNYNVDCNNDAEFEGSNQQGNFACNYGESGLNSGAGVYTIRIRDANGDGTGFPRYYATINGEQTKVQSVDQWGNIKWTSFGHAFAGTSELSILSTDPPDLSLVSDMSYAFYQSGLGTPDLSAWDLSTVKDMRYLFGQAENFNGNVDTWDSSSATNMSGIFQGASKFSQDISGWNTSEVTDMSSMFSGALAFDQDISAWEIGSVTDMTNMFAEGSYLSVENYDKLLKAWSSQAVLPDVPFGAGESKYCLGAAGRASLIDNGWQIVDGGADCEIDDITPTTSEDDIIINILPNKVMTVKITFSENVYDPSGDSETNDVTNPENYMIIENGPNTQLDTLSCGAGVAGDDVSMSIDSVYYDDTSFTATLTMSEPLDGIYALFVCGTTSIEDLSGNKVNRGISDIVIMIDSANAIKVHNPSSDTNSLASAYLPNTGFPQGVRQELTEQPMAAMHDETSIWVSIPSLGIMAKVVGVPVVEGKWDASWLGDQVGWLEGSAYPTWAGNTVIVGHVWNAYNEPGVFIDLSTLVKGDRVEILSNGATYVYEVKESIQRWSTEKYGNVIKNHNDDWVTLITCEGYVESSGSYLYHRVVSAELISIE